MTVALSVSLMNEGPEALSTELRRLLVALLSLLSLYVAGVLVTFIILSKVSPPSSHWTSRQP